MTDVSAHAPVAGSGVGAVSGDHVARQAPPAADPAVLALPIFIIASVGLGFSLVGWYPAAAGGALAPLAVVTALFLTVACIWSSSLGRSYDAGVQGVFSAFWWGYAVWTLGALHGWFGVPATAIGQATQLFLISFLVVAALLTLASMRGPLVFTTFIGFITVAVTLILLNTIAPSTGLSDLAGAAVLVFCAIGGYMFVGAASVAMGGPSLPHGAPLLGPHRR